MIRRALAVTLTACVNPLTFCGNVASYFFSCQDKLMKFPGKNGCLRVENANARAVALLVRLRRG
jgi:hypothetical protein